MRESSLVKELINKKTQRLNYMMNVSYKISLVTLFEFLILPHNYQDKCTKNNPDLEEEKNITTYKEKKTKCKKGKKRKKKELRKKPLNYIHVIDLYIAI